MVIQYRVKGKRWKKYPGKKYLDRAPSKFQWRLLNEEQNKQLWPAKGKEYSNYDDVLQNMRRIEFYKHMKSRGALSVVFKKYKTNKKGGQHYHINKNRGMGVYIYRKRLGGKHLGDETDPEIAQLRQAAPVPGKYSKFPEGQMQYAFDRIIEDKGDIQEVRVTDPDDYIAYQWKQGEGTTFPEKEKMFPKEYDNKLAPDKLKQVKKLRDDK